MLILTSLDSLSLTRDNFPEKLDDIEESHYQLLFHSIQGIFNDECRNPDAYLSDAFDKDSVVLGIYEPDKLIETVSSWNDSIKKAFVAALRGVLPDTGAIETIDVESIPMDTTKTYELSCAVRELDNLWFEYAEHGIYLPNEMGYAYFTTILDPYDEESVKAYPEEYLLLSVDPK